MRKTVVSIHNSFKDANQKRHQTSHNNVWIKLERTIRRYKLGYAFSATLCFIGIAALFVVMRETWPEVSSNSNPLSTFWSLLWTKQFSPIPGVEFKLMYLVVLAAATLTSGAAVFAFSRQWFSLPGKTIRFQCPFCKKYWMASHDRGQVVCPHCHHLVHPKMSEK